MVHSTLQFRAFCFSDHRYIDLRVMGDSIFRSLSGFFDSAQI